MRAEEFTSRLDEIASPTGKSEIFLDMDGVLADFFDEYAKLAGLPAGSSYRDIPPAKADPTLNKMVGTDFFYRLPKLHGADASVKIATQLFGHYNICSSPLRGDHENSGIQKTRWIRKHLNPQPGKIIITPNKSQYATQPDGTPNILIDDRKDNIIKWEQAGGIGIKYQADEDSLKVIFDGLRKALPVIKGREPHQQQTLTPSIDRSMPVATDVVQEDSVGDLEKDLKNPHGYDAIDHMMQTVARKNKISPKQLHDLFVKKHQQTPDDWIKSK